MAEQVIVLDEGKIFEKIQDLPNQLEKAWTNLWVKDLPIDASKIKSVVIAGMGGSGIAGQLAQELLQDTAIPITTWADYGLPNWVNDSTLVIALSYSGETEETIDVVKQAIEKKIPVVALSKGGKLLELSQIHGFPFVAIEYDSTPRSAVGWLYGSLITVLAKLKIASIQEKGYFSALEELRTVVKSKIFPPKAEEIAMGLSNKVPVIMAHSPLTAVATRWVTQFNENSKTLAINAKVPELCHNFLVGMEFPIPEKLMGIFLESNYGFSRNVARKKVLQKVFTQKEVPFIPLSVKTESLLAEQLLLLHFGDLVSYYLAGVNGVDPTPVETIQQLKEELKKV